MKEVNADLWKYRADVRLIPTNGEVKASGLAVMGKGVAEEAKRRYPTLDHQLGFMLEMYGNKALIIRTSGDGHDCVWSFPTKHKWKDAADLALIKTSAEQVAKYADRHEQLFGFVPVIAMPRPGCGNGGLQWEDVKPVIADLLDDRFVITHLEPKPV